MQLSRTKLGTIRFVNIKSLSESYIRRTPHSFRTVITCYTEMEGLKGKVAVVTGASEGIGEAIVRRLAAEGMRVAALARRGEKLVELEKDLKANGYTVKGYICDVQSEIDVKAAFKSIEEDFGAVTALINNAGVLKLIPLQDLNIEDARTIFNTNVIGVLSCTKEALASMKNYSIAQGHIVNINSVAGHREAGNQNYAIYAASKHALTSLTNSLRNELKSSNIRVTSISPALVKTSMTEFYMKASPDLPHLVASDLADAVLYALTAPSNVNVSEIILDNI